ALKMMVSRLALGRGGRKEAPISAHPDKATLNKTVSAGAISDPDDSTIRAQLPGAGVSVLDTKPVVGEDIAGRIVIDRALPVSSWSRTQKGLWQRAAGVSLISPTESQETRSCMKLASRATGRRRTTTSSIHAMPLRRDLHPCPPRGGATKARCSGSGGGSTRI